MHIADDIRTTARFLTEAASSGYTDDLGNDLADVYETWGPHVMEALDSPLGSGIVRLQLGAEYGPRMALEGVNRIRIANGGIENALSLKVPIDGGAWTHEVRTAAEALAPFLA